MCDDSSLLKFK